MNSVLGLLRNNSRKLFWIALSTSVIGFAFIYYSYFYCQFYTHIRPEYLKNMKVYEGNRITGLRGQQVIIHKGFSKALDRVDKLAEKYDIHLIVNSSYRSKKVQATKSNHLAGYAIDFNLIYKGKKYFTKDLKLSNLLKLPKPIQNFLIAVNDDSTLRWGGYFNDPIHIDSPINKRDGTEYSQAKKACLKDYKQRKPLLSFLPKRLTRRLTKR